MGKDAVLLSDLCRGVGQCVRDARVSDLVTDSRAVTPGCLFAAVPGYEHKGSSFVQDALTRGAKGIIAEENLSLPDTVGLVLVDDVRAILGLVAARFFGTFEHNMALLVVTGTNGKTSTVQLIRQLLQALDQRVATVGTLGFQLPESMSVTQNTTPDVVEIHRFLASAAAQQVAWAALEASSHGLVQNRLAGLTVGVAAMTNITQDHLDYHGTMAEYIAAKARILHLSGVHTVVMDLDDAQVRELRSQVPANVRVLGLSLDAVAEADVLVTAEYHAWGTDARMRFEGREVPLRLPLVGEFYLRNTLTAIVMLWAEGFDLAALVRAAGHLKGVPGRLESVAIDSDLAVYVDYAHTPDAITRVLKVLRPTVANDLWVVFGCGGDRDRSKRPLMGRAACEGADWVVLTSDNPRSEDSLSILADIQAGCPNPRFVMQDRAEAIQAAIAAAAPGDTVVIAGKGHETEQLIGQIAYPFSDVAVAQAALAVRKCA